MVGSHVILLQKILMSWQWIFTKSYDYLYQVSNCICKLYNPLTIFYSAQTFPAYTTSPSLNQIWKSKWWGWEKDKHIYNLESETKDQKQHINMKNDSELWICLPDWIMWGYGWTGFCFPFFSMTPEMHFNLNWLYFNGSVHDLFLRWGSQQCWANVLLFPLSTFLLV